MQTRTSTQLLEDLRDPSNAQAWTAFDARYRPVLIAFGRRLGLDLDTAGELAQQTLSEFVRGYLGGRYSRDQGRLSSWLIGIARNVASAMRRNRREAAHGSRIDELPAEDELTGVWVVERERAILVEALHRLRESSRVGESTFRAFELFALEGVPVEEVAATCGISVDAVYLAKSRLTRRLRELVGEITALFDGDE